MTRLWPQGSSIEVVCDEAGRPRRFTWQAQEHQVADITMRWRVHMEWWRERIWRDYFKLTTQTGLLVILYQDLNSRRWYLQRLYD